MPLTFAPASDDASAPLAFPSPEKLHEIQDLYENGLTLKAWAVAQECGPLREWQGTPARILAGRLAGQLGAQRLGRALHWTTWRQDPTDPLALYYYTRDLFERRGPLATSEFMAARGELPDAPDDLRSDWFCMHARLAASVRDFEAAESWLARAEALTPQSPWLWVERAMVLERQDKYPEALAAARKAKQIRPWYRPAVQTAAHLLQLLDCDAEALELLRQACNRLESGAVAAQLAMLESELKQFNDARASWEKVAAMSPLAEEDFAKAIAARRADAAYDCGDYAAAAEWARQSDNEFHKDLAKRLAETGGAGARVALPIGFVRQHHMTCAPATLSTLGRYWSSKVEHLSLAEEICYDGTSSHSERSWANKGGWVSREFTVTWDSAVALLDLGVPFTLTTVEPASGHLQAVIGYDSVRGTLLIRDPYERNAREFLCDKLIERYKSSGPRGMAIVPADKASLLEGLDLPDADLHDRLFAVTDALVRHKRDEAVAAYEAMQAAAPGHRLTLQARRSIAGYDSNPTEILQCADAVLALYPGDPNTLLTKLSCLRALGKRDERIALLRQAWAAEDADPLFWSELAQELRDDAREYRATLRLLRRTLRYRRGEAQSYSALAGLLWEQCRREEALPLFRWAMCLEDKREQYARSYFVACRHFKRDEEALRLMQDRFRRFGAKSSGPARTLFWAFEEMNRATDGFNALNEALTARPDDGELLLFTADARVRYGDLAGGGELLRRAKDRSQATAWLRASARVAKLRADTREALSLWRQVVEAEPLAIDGHQNVAQLLAETEGRAAALAHLEAAADRFPHCDPLLRLLIEFVREEPAPKAEPFIRRMTTVNPTDAWARRELVTCLLRQGRHDEALAEAETATHLDPGNPSSHYCRGKALSALQRPAEACAAYMRAVELYVDADYAIVELIRSCDEDEQRREALAFVREQLARQTSFGDGLVAYCSIAREHLDGAEFLTWLRETMAARQDLWQAWSLCVRQLQDTGRVDEAMELARKAVARFPLIAPLWTDLATTCRLASDKAGELAALQHALRIDPSWSHAARQLAAAYERTGEFEQAKVVLEQAVTRDPLDAANVGGLAETLWKLGQKEQAVARVTQALRLEPDADWGWACLSEWGEAVGRPTAALDLARELTQQRGGEARPWMLLARLIQGPPDAPERMAAVDKAIALDPRYQEAHDFRAELLAVAGRWDEALASCRPAAWGDAAPLELRGRAAWVEWHRGNHDAAIRQMRQAVESDPKYQWGWLRLAEWHRARQDLPGFLEAAEHMVRTWPNNVIALCCRGEALAVKGERLAAKADLRRAVELSPDYERAAPHLFDLHLEDGELDAAARLLDTLRRHLPGDPTSARAVELAAKRSTSPAAVQSDAQAGLGALMELCTGPGRDTGPLEFAVNAIFNTPWWTQMESVFRAALDGGNVNPALGGVWVDFLAATDRLKDAMALVDQNVARGDFFHCAASSLLFQAGKAGQAALVRRCINKHGKALSADVSSWGAVGQALLFIGEDANCAKWLGDWRQRQGVSAMALSILLSGLRKLGRDAEGAAVLEFALSLPEDSSRPHLELLRAFEEATSSQHPRAAERLAKIDPESLPADEKFVYHLTAALLELAGAGNSPHGRARAMSAVKAKVALAEKNHPQFRTQPELAVMYRRALALIARTDFPTKLWCIWRRAHLPIAG